MSAWPGAVVPCSQFPSCGRRRVQAATAVSVDGRTDHPVDAPFHSTHLELSPITRYVGSVAAHFQAPTQDRFVHQKLGLTVLHVLNICTNYSDSRRYFSYIV